VTVRDWLRRSAFRVLGALFVLLVVATVAFAALQLIPGDPAEAALGGPGSQASAEALEAARAQFGLDRPILTQYFDFLNRTIRGDLGISFAQHIPVSAVVGAALGPTLLLALMALALAWLLALASIIVASGHSRLARGMTTALDLVAAAIPNFWLASLLVLLFASTLGWLPSVSTGGVRGIILPAIALALPTAGFIAQVCRSGIDDARNAPFIESARARGETEAGIRVRHLLRHGVVPGVNLTAWALGSLLGGAAVIEVLFARPGLGRTLVDAVLIRDIPVVLGVVLFAAAAYVIVSLVTDVIVSRVDPRTEQRLQRAVAGA